MLDHPGRLTHKRIVDPSILTHYMSPFVIQGMQARMQRACGECVCTPLAGQIISKSCSFSPETEFTPLILASKSNLRFAPFFIKFLKFAPPFSQVCIWAWSVCIILFIFTESSVSYMWYIYFFFGLILGGQSQFTMGFCLKVGQFEKQEIFCPNYNIFTMNMQTVFRLCTLWLICYCYNINWLLKFNQ